MPFDVAGEVRYAVRDDTGRITAVVVGPRPTGRTTAIARVAFSEPVGDDTARLIVQGVTIDPLDFTSSSRRRRLHGPGDAGPVGRRPLVRERGLCATSSTSLQISCLPGTQDDLDLLVALD
jgi:hypothetical protein